MVQNYYSTLSKRYTLVKNTFLINFHVKIHQLMPAMNPQ